MKCIITLVFLPLFLNGLEIEDVPQNTEIMPQLLQRVSKLEQDLEERVTKLENLAKVGTLRSCAEYADFGLKTSGLYLIDPDGPLISQQPFQVLCNFNLAGTSTEVLHDAGTLTYVDHCHDAGCFEKNVTYLSGATNESVPLSQIDALMQLSEYCVQGFYYECTLAPLRADDIDFAFWIDRHGEKNVYFTGANKGFHSCDCNFSDEGCFEQDTRGNRCNCDANQPAPLIDTGTLSDMTALPVMKLAFGGVPYEIQRGAFQLGNLQCFGKTDPEIGSSCSALKLKGITTSGYYEIKKPGDHSTTLVFCDMEQDGYVDVPQIEQSDDSPLGTISSWVSKPSEDASPEPIPDGWVLCDGSLIEKGIWAGGRTPDLNSGHFLRGGDLHHQLKMEQDQIQDHLHYDPGHSHTASSSSSAGSHHHTHEDYYMDGPTLNTHTTGTTHGYCQAIATCDFAKYHYKNTGDGSVSVSTSTEVNSHKTGITGVTSSFRRGQETRPKNMKVSWIMKCW